MHEAAVPSDATSKGDWGQACAYYCLLYATDVLTLAGAYQTCFETSPTACNIPPLNMGSL